MKPDSINRWLTLGANFGVLIGIILLLVELNQNATIMKAQISNERASQAIDLFLSIAESQELSSIDARLNASGFPGDPRAIESLNPIEQHQYKMYLRAQQYRIENVLYQQALGVVSDPEAVARAKEFLPKFQAVRAAGLDRVEQLILAAEGARD